MKQSLILMVVLVVVTALSSFAQAQGNAGAGTPAPAVMTLTDQGLIIVRGAAVAKFDLAKLESKGVIDIFGPMPAAPAAGAQKADRITYRAEMTKREATPVMIAVADTKAKTSNLFIVIGDQFVNIDLITFKVLANVSTAAPVDPAGVDPKGNGRGQWQQAAAIIPVLQYNEKEGTLYVLKGTGIITINVADGKVAARGTLPKELIPANANPWGGKGGGKGGGNNQPPAADPVPAVPVN